MLLFSDALHMFSVSESKSNLSFWRIGGRWSRSYICRSQGWVVKDWRSLFRSAGRFQGRWEASFTGSGLKVLAFTAGALQLGLDWPSPAVILLGTVIGLLNVYLLKFRVILYLLYQRLGGILPKSKAIVWVFCLRLVPGLKPHWNSWGNKERLNRSGEFNRII